MDCDTWRLTVWVKGLRGMVVTYEDFLSKQALLEYATKYKHWHEHISQSEVCFRPELALYDLQSVNGVWTLYKS